MLHPIDEIEEQVYKMAREGVAKWGREAELEVLDSAIELHARVCRNPRCPGDARARRVRQRLTEQPPLTDRTRMAGPRQEEDIIREMVAQCIRYGEQRGGINAVEAEFARSHREHAALTKCDDPNYIKHLMPEIERRVREHFGSKLTAEQISKMHAEMTDGHK